MVATVNRCGKYLAAWGVMLVVAVANGTLRDFTYGRHMSELAAHQLSTVIILVLLGIVMGRFMRRHPAKDAAQAWTIGLAWTSMTVAFEFLFFHYVGGHPWSELLASYDLTRGRVWVAVPLWLAVAPRLFHGFRHGSRT